MLRLILAGALGAILVAGSKYDPKPGDEVRIIGGNMKYCGQNGTVEVCIDKGKKVGVRLDNGDKVKFSNKNVFPIDNMRLQDQLNELAFEMENTYPGGLPKQSSDYLNQINNHGMCSHYALQDETKLRQEMSCLNQALIQKYEETMRTYEELKTLLVRRDTQESRDLLATLKRTMDPIEEGNARVSKGLVTSLNSDLVKWKRITGSSTQETTTLAELIRDYKNAKDELSRRGSQDRRKEVCQKACDNNLPPFTEREARTKYGGQPHQQIGFIKHCREVGLIQV